MFKALVDLYATPDLLTTATAAQRDHFAQQQQQRSDGSRTIESEIKKTEAAIERYMQAFERGALADDALEDRVRDLGLKATTLRSCQVELSQTEGTIDLDFSTPSIETTHRHLQLITDRAPEELRKAVAHAFVKNLHVDSPTQVTPTFRVIGAPPDIWPPKRTESGGDTGVRAMTSLVGDTGLEPVTSRM